MHRRVAIDDLHRCALHFDTSDIAIKQISDVVVGTLPGYCKEAAAETYHVQKANGDLSKALRPGRRFCNKTRDHGSSRARRRKERKRVVGASSHCVEMTYNIHQCKPRLLMPSQETVTTRYLTPIPSLERRKLALCAVEQATEAKSTATRPHRHILLVRLNCTKLMSRSNQHRNT